MYPIKEPGMDPIKILIAVLLLLTGIMINMALFYTLLNRLAVAVETQNALANRIAMVEAKCQEQERALHTLGMIARSELEAAKEMNERMKRK